MPLKDLNDEATLPAHAAQSSSPSYNGAFMVATFVYFIPVLLLILAATLSWYSCVYGSGVLSDPQVRLAGLGYYIDTPESGYQNDHLHKYSSSNSIVPKGGDCYVGPDAYPKIRSSLEIAFSFSVAAAAMNVLAASIFVVRLIRHPSSRPLLIGEIALLSIALICTLLSWAIALGVLSVTSEYQLTDSWALAMTAFCYSLVHLVVLLVLSRPILFSNQAFEVLT